MQTLDEQTLYHHAVIRPPTKADNGKRYTRIVIDSKDRDMNLFPEPNRYEIMLYDDIEDIVTAQLLSSSVSLTGYMINSNHNTIPFTIGSTSYVATLDDGDYSAADLATAIQTKMSSVSGVSFTVTYSDKTGKLTISTATTDFTVNITTDNAASLGRILGFNLKKNYPSTSKSLTIPGRVNLEYFKYIVMDIASFDINKSTNSTLNKSFAVLGSSQIKKNFNDSPEIIKTFMPPLARLNKIQVSFWDRDGNLYDFNGVDHWFEVLFCSYKQNKRYMNIYADR